MRDKRTSKAQIKCYTNFKNYMEKLILKADGYTLESEDKFTGETEKNIVTLELETRLPGTRYSIDMLLTIQSKITGKISQFAIEYDCLQWHRKWTDEKKNDVLVDHDINVVRIQTFDLQPNPKVLWTFIRDIWKQDEIKVMYYQLPDFINDIWTGKIFLCYK